jgi:hypothetical protein
VVGAVSNTVKPRQTAFDVLDSVANPKNSVAKGILNNLEKRGEALVNTPSSISKLFHKEGAPGVAGAFIKGLGHLVKETGEAAGDIAWEAKHYQGSKSAEKISNRATDVLLNTADMVTLVAGGAGAAKGGLSAAKGGLSMAESAVTSSFSATRALEPALAMAGKGVKAGEGALQAAGIGTKLGPPGLGAVGTPLVAASATGKGANEAKVPRTGEASPGPKSHPEPRPDARLKAKAKPESPQPGSSVPAKRRWRLGDPHDMPGRGGGKPTWKTVKERYWKNRAATAQPGEFGKPDLKSMRKGRAPIDPHSRKPLELEHVTPQRTGDPNMHRDLLEVTPLEHSFFDKHRKFADPAGGKFRTNRFTDPRP